MKILVLMPVDEQHVVSSLMLMNELSRDVKNITVCMPAYADFLFTSKIAHNWEDAVLKSFLTARGEYNYAEQNDKNIIIIGNLSQKFTFDLIVNYDDGIDSVEYKDNFLKLLQSKVPSTGEREVQILKEVILNTYDNNASTMQMRDKIATAEFLSKYVKTGVKNYDKLKQQYKSRIKFVEVG